MSDSIVETNQHINLKDDVEEWYPLSPIGYSNYNISTHGNIKNITGKLLSLCTTGEGYISVSITNDKRVRCPIRIHTLMGKRFLDCDGKIMTVDHIDRNRSNNNLKNLRAATKSEQRLNSVRTKNPGRRVTQLSKEGDVIQVWNTITEAQNTLGLFGDSIGKACKTRKLYRGYLWEFTDDKDLEGEIWKSTKEVFPEWKEILVSSMGRIKRLSGPQKGKVSIGSEQGGYLLIQVYRNSDNKYIIVGVHRIVCACFQEERRDDMLVNHKDGNKGNNRSENLEYVTSSENTRHAIKMKLRNPSTSKKLNIKVQQFTPSGEFVKEYDSIKNASIAMGLSKKSYGISLVCSGKQKLAAGYLWKKVL